MVLGGKVAACKLTTIIVGYMCEPNLQSCSLYSTLICSLQLHADHTFTIWCITISKALDFKRLLLCWGLSLISDDGIVRIQELQLLKLVILIVGRIELAVIRKKLDLYSSDHSTYLTNGFFFLMKNMRSVFLYFKTWRFTCYSMIMPSYLKLVVLLSE